MSSTRSSTAWTRPPEVGVASWAGPSSYPSSYPSPPPAAAEYLVGDAKTYRFLSNDNLQVQGISDANEYEDTREAMNIMGMSDDEQTGEDWQRGPVPGRLVGAGAGAASGGRCRGG